MNNKLCLFLLLLSQIGSASEIALSPQALIDRSLAVSDRIGQIEKKRQIQDMEWSDELEKYDYVFEFSPYYSKTEAESLDGFANKEEKRIGYNFSLGKNLLSGTKLQLAYEKVGAKTQFNTFNLTRNIPDRQYKDVFKIQLEQSLWRNSFGKVNRSIREDEEEKQVYYDFDKMEDLESSILESMELYWKAYVAQKNFEETLKSRARYSSLLKSVQKKSRLGYTAPGELARTKAELEMQEQKVKIASQRLLLIMNQLKYRLKFDPQIQIVFSIDNELPDVPVVETIELEKLRRIQRMETRKRSAERFKIIAESNSKPELNMVARIESTGVETTGEDSFEELAKFSKPTYYLGMRLRFHFGSGSNSASVQNASYKKELVKLENNIEKENLIVDLKNQENLVKSSYLIAKSAIQLLSLREKSMKQIKKAYTQGRVDIQELINSYNALAMAATEKISYIGEYHMNLNRLSAKRDELVKQ